VRQPGEQPDRLSEILRLWLVEVENDRQVAVERLENPIAMLNPQILKHRKGLLSLLDNGSKRHHDLRDRRLQFKRSGCDHEVRQPGEQPDRLSEILRLWLVEVENDRQVAGLIFDDELF
jgi:hypothetical protein